MACDCNLDTGTSDYTASVQGANPSGSSTILRAVG